MTHYKKETTVATLVTIIIVFLLLLWAIIWFSRNAHQKRYGVIASNKPLKGFNALSELNNGALQSLVANPMGMSPMSPNGSIVVVRNPQGLQSPQQQRPGISGIANALGNAYNTISNGVGNAMNHAAELNLQSYSPTTGVMGANNNNLNNDGSESNSDNFKANNAGYSNNGVHHIIRFYGQHSCDVSSKFEEIWKIVHNRMKAGPDSKYLHFHKIMCDGDKQNEQLKCSVAKINGGHLQWTPTVTIAPKGEPNELLLSDETISPERLEQAIRSFINNYNNNNNQRRG